MRRSPLRRAGKVARKWMEVQQAFLAARGEGVYPCQCPGLDLSCRRDVRVWKQGDRWKSDGHVHHLLTRARRPDLRYEFSNLMLIHPDCHRRIHTHA